MNYDFSQLNDKEFEVFTTDLLGEVLGERLERFKPGRDGGVDGRYFNSSNGEVVVQCKHYLKTGYPGLIGKLNKEEKEKVNKLNPHKYILVTSLPLSRDNKKEIRTIFSPYIQRDDDVIGQEDLNDFLGKHPDIEERHFKLWISSTTVFNRIINNAIKGRSEHEIEQIQKKSYKFVQTDTYDKALSILKLNHVLIITGEPGIGKTTLAENICLYFSSKDFEFIDIEDSLSDAENIYTRGKKQIFYFDDFLGSNYFEAITNKKDSHIIKFIDRIKSDNTKLFILTSRTNILNSGVLHSSIFSNKNIQQDEYLLTIKSLTRMDRARILYNHIWFSDLTEEFIDEIYKNRRYTKIINHQNYNPRLVEFITDISRISASNSDEYWRYIGATLRNPKDIWGNCFKVQNNSYVRNLVSLTVFNGGNISESDLRESFNRFNQINTVSNPSHTEKDFISIAQLATKSFLKRHYAGKDVFYSLFNPSLSDYILSEYCSDLEWLCNIFRSLGTLQSLRQLISLGEEGVIASKYMNQLRDLVFGEALNRVKSYDYQIIASDMVCTDETKKGKIIQVIRGIVDQPSPIKQFSKFLGLLIRYYDDLSIDSHKFIYYMVSNRYLDETEIKALAEFMDNYDIDDDHVTNELRMSLKNLIGEELNTRKADIDLSGIVDVHYGEYGEEDVRYDSVEIESELSVIAASVLEDFQYDVFDNINIDVDSIVREVDINEMVNEYLDSQIEPDYEGYRNRGVDKEQDIDDLFERT